MFHLKKIYIHEFVDPIDPDFQFYKTIATPLQKNS